MSTKTKSKQLHVVPSDRRWKVVRPRASRATGVYGEKTEAVKRAQGLAQKEGSSVVTHRKDGRITGIKSYGKKREPQLHDLRKRGVTINKNELIIEIKTGIALRYYVEDNREFIGDKKSLVYDIFNWIEKEDPEFVEKLRERYGYDIKSDGL